MTGHILLSVLVAIVAMLAFYTWLDRFIVRLENWNLFAYVAGAAFGALALATTLSLGAGW